MIEKLREGSGNIEPMNVVVELVKKQKEKKRCVSVAEIGVGYGATSVEIIKVLNNEDNYFFFDFEETVKELLSDLEKININEVSLIGIGNTSKRYDSYAWNIAQLYIRWEKNGEDVHKFDVVYLDGAHTFLFDVSAASILKEMIPIGGYIVLDDVNWSIATSPTCNPQRNPQILDNFTQEQIEACHIDVVKQVIFDNDERYARIDNYNRIAIFRREK